MITKRVRDISKTRKVSMHMNLNDPDLNRSYYFFMKYLRRSKILPMKQASIIVRNLYQLFFDIIDNVKNLRDITFIQRVFSEIQRILKLKLRFYRGKNK
jgi:hypothetical protein